MHVLTTGDSEDDIVDICTIEEKRGCFADVLKRINEKNNNNDSNVEALNSFRSSMMRPQEMRGR